MAVAGPTANEATGEASGAEEAVVTERAPREKRSRDRYGRDRRERGGLPRADAESPESAAVAAAEPAGMDAPTSPATGHDAAPVAAPVTAAPVVAPEARPAAPAIAAPVPATQAAADAASVVAAYVLPINTLHEVATSAGLQWVNSDAERIAKVQAEIAAEPAPVHVPRVIQPVVLPDEGPLVLVETRRDLSKTSFPFDAER